MKEVTTSGMRQIRFLTFSANPRMPSVSVTEACIATHVKEYVQLKWLESCRDGEGGRKVSAFPIFHDIGLAVKMLFQTEVFCKRPPWLCIGL